MDAENSKSALCKSYIGKAVPVTAFDALSQSLVATGSKGEFETTAQYNARRTKVAARPPTGPVVLAVPANREHIRYDADSKAIVVSAGAFIAGSFSGETQAEIAAEVLLIRMKLSNGVPVPHSQSERLVRSYPSRNGFGIPIRVSDVDRHTRALYVDAPRLFSFAKDDQSTVMGFEASSVRATHLKQTVGVALVLEPKAPFLLSGSLQGAAATSRSPVQYTERSSILVVKARCGLVIDGQSRVLASIDAG